MIVKGPFWLARMTIVFKIIHSFEYLNFSFHNYITKKNQNLLDGDRRLLFTSFNVPNLLFIEDYKENVYDIPF